MAEGPALNVFQSIFTPGPMAFSNQPLALPTIACGCVILGNAPTRTTVWLTPGEITDSRKLTMIRALNFIAYSRTRFPCTGMGRTFVALSLGLGLRWAFPPRGLESLIRSASEVFSRIFAAASRTDRKSVV